MVKSRKVSEKNANLSEIHFMDRQGIGQNVLLIAIEFEPDE